MNEEKYNNFYYYFYEMTTHMTSKYFILYVQNKYVCILYMFIQLQMFVQGWINISLFTLSIYHYTSIHRYITIYFSRYISLHAHVFLNKHSKIHIYEYIYIYINICTYLQTYIGSIIEDLQTPSVVCMSLTGTGSIHPSTNIYKHMCIKHTYIFA